MERLEAQLIHDMRNAAMVLREGADQLQDGVQTLPLEAVDHLCSMLVRRSEMLVRLLDDLASSDLADHEALDLSSAAVSLAEICAEALSGRPVPTGVTITLDVPADLVVLADPMRLAQVVDNLLSNALRYGGPAVRLTALREGGEVRLSVSDDGNGVPDELQGRLFDGYARGDGSNGFGGSGLGLLIVRQLVEAMGGTVAHHQHRGTTFTVALPALPVVHRPLLPDQAAHGHAVKLWTDDGAGDRDPVVAGLASYAAHGLTRGEAVVVVATVPRLARLASALGDLGIDPAAAAATGQ